MRDPLIVIHHAGRTLLMEKIERHSFSAFGGPLGLSIDGLPPHRSLHHIAWLNHNQLKCRALPRYIPNLPLIYPMRYSGGTLSYAFSRESIEVLGLEPSEPSESWPYVGFPDLLPYHPIEVSSVIPEDWAAFAKRAPNLPEEQPSELVVLVPPPQGLGFTMWGREGDAEGVTLVFECNLSAMKVITYNVCS